MHRSPLNVEGSRTTEVDEMKAEGGDMKDLISKLREEATGEGRSLEHPLLTKRELQKSLICD